MTLIKNHKNDQRKMNINHWIWTQPVRSIKHKSTASTLSHTNMSTHCRFERPCWTGISRTTKWTRLCSVSDLWTASAPLPAWTSTVKQYPSVTVHFTWTQSQHFYTASCIYINFFLTHSIKLLFGVFFCVFVCCCCFGGQGSFLCVWFQCDKL